MARTHYELLQVAPDASPEVISAAWRAQMQALRKHPDLGGDEREAASLNEAHDTLTDPARRERYDAMLTAGRSATPRPDGAHEERRRAPRHEIDAVVSYCVNHDARWHAARVVDFSILGVRLRSHEPLRVGQQVVIVPPNLASFALHGVVRWTRAFHPSIFERVYEAGVEFPDQMTDIEQRLAI